MQPYFNPSCFSGFKNENIKGFYRVYGDLFKKLDEEEEQEEEVGKDHVHAPSFGDSDSSFEDVAAFYNHWQHFTTLKQFSYADVYNPNEAPNRRVKRIIEEENRKERNKERSKFNALVV